ncbi:MAG TPA: hypothetical protein VMW24_19280 [Sedimentisphaerales bacterium]|nr:hypothetical protein [Sedimentisphaerales bacterium]
MATILLGYPAPDGFDIRVRLADGRQHTFHSQAGEPKDAQVFVDDCERKLFAVEAEQLRIAAIPVEPTLSQATDAQIRAEAEKRSIVIGALKP